MTELVLCRPHRLLSQGRGAADLFNNILHIPAHKENMIRRLAPSLQKGHINRA